MCTHSDVDTAYQRGLEDAARVAHEAHAQVERETANVDMYIGASRVCDAIRALKEKREDSDE
jgi:hypothetical protein